MYPINTMGLVYWIIFSSLSQRCDPNQCTVFQAFCKIPHYRAAIETYRNSSGYLENELLFVFKDISTSEQSQIKNFFFSLLNRSTAIIRGVSHSATYIHYPISYEFINLPILFETLKYKRDIIKEQIDDLSEIPGLIHHKIDTSESFVIV